MLFNSFQFLIFFVIVYGLYLKLQHKWQNRMLLAASYIFYAAWDWRFSSLILFSTTLNYFCGLKIFASDDVKRRKFFLIISLVGNLSILGFFKYFNFFMGNFYGLCDVIGLPVRSHTFNIILPLGISFYTLQSLSYTIDIYRKGMKPTRDFIGFALFVSFFPQLVAGPIERARNLLPQVLSERKITLERFYEGAHLFFWGFFLKVFIADNLANIVSPVFDKNPPYNGLEVLLAAYAFTFQIFCDFKGYSSMARGLAKTMGFDLMLNFNLPYFVTNIQEFWNKWHISLSSWVRDYIYMPVFFSMRNVGAGLRISIVLMITMAIMGLWHGANWIFVAWGLYHGFLLVAYMFIRNRCKDWIKPKSVFGQNLWLILRMVFTFHLIVLGMLVFRAQWGKQVIDMTYAMLFNIRPFDAMYSIMLQIISYTWILWVVQVFQYMKKDLNISYQASVPVRAGFYYICLLLLIIGGSPYGQEFIYFQF